MSNSVTPPPAATDAPPRSCRNCSTPLSGPYCSACGQHDIDYHRSFHHLAHDLLESLFHFEGKSFVTIAWLLAYPGRLTNEFIAGRRHRQLHPLRFYIFVSLLFFVGLSLLNHGHLIDFDRRQADQLQQKLATKLENARGASAHFTDAEKQEFARRFTVAGTTGQIDSENLEETLQLVQDVAARRARESSATATPAPVETKPAAPRTAPRNAFEHFVRRLESGDLRFADIANAIEQRIPSLFFFGVPLFALLLKLLYLRSGRYYIEHLIFSLHLHTWAFLVIMVGNGYLELASLGPAWIGTVLTWFLFAWSAWYALTAFRRVYLQTWPKTVLKLSLLTLVHGFLLLCAALLLIVGTVFWLALT